MKILFYIVLLISTDAYAESFDCAKASTVVEKMICEDAEINSLDEEMSAAYKKLIETRDHSQRIMTEADQKKWLTLRNTCSDRSCLEARYKLRVEVLSALYKQKYYFRLTKGVDVPVCQAYHKRLNLTKFDKPPHCGRPENDAVTGFSRLNRVPLKIEDFRSIYPVLKEYINSANYDGYDFSNMDFQEELARKGKHRVTYTAEMALERSIARGVGKVWRYDPRVDMDNDGKEDNIQVWYGLLASTGGPVCGQGNRMIRTQLMFYVNDDGTRLDVAKTEQVFAHPEGGYFFERSGKIVKARSYRPIGPLMDIFQYDSEYYFDTFFDDWGDYEGERVKVSDPPIWNTLGVFLRKNGKTKQICEYQMYQ